MVCFFIVSVFTISTLHNVDTLVSKLYSTSLKKELSRHCINRHKTQTFIAYTIDGVYFRSKYCD